jgi:hypothetical protein
MQPTTASSVSLAESGLDSPLIKGPARVASYPMVDA